MLTSALTAVIAAAPTSATADEILNLMDSLDEDYQANAAFLMRKSTLNAIRRLKSSSGGAFMFPTAQAPDGQQLLARRRVFASPSMDALSDVGKPIAYGDLSRFVRRVVSGSLAVRVYQERYAEFAQSAFESFLRCDGALLKTSTSIPVRYITMA